jgi:thioredoxin 1
MSEVKPVTSADFKEEVEEAKGLVLVDFWAPPCGPCQMLAPVIEEIANELGDKIKVLKLDVYENHKIAVQFGVTGIPTVILFKDGKAVESIDALRPKQVYLDAINKHLD